MMYKPTSKEELEKEAKRLGMIAIFPEDNEIMLDLDAGMKLNTNTFYLIPDMDTIILGGLETTSQGGNKHYYVWISRPMSVIQQIAFAACLGSDPVREMLAALYYLTHEQFTMCLFEKPEEAQRVYSWRARLKVTAAAKPSDDEDQFRL